MIPKTMRQRAKKIWFLMVAIVFAATLTAYAQPANQARWNHYLDIGTAFYFEGQQDSAKVYLEQVFENNVEMKMTAARYLLDIALSEGDTPKINEYGLFLAENYDLSINQERQKSYRRIVFICVAALLLLLAMVWVLLRQRKTNTKQRQAYDQQRLSYDQQLNAAQSAIEKQAFENLQKQAKEILSKGNQRKRILEAFNSVYPHAYDRLRSTYPDLTEQEIDLLVLNFLEFRIKEEAEILELSQNTVMKYRSNLIKKVGKDPIPRLL